MLLMKINWHVIDWLISLNGFDEQFIYAYFYVKNIQQSASKASISVEMPD